MTRPLAGRRVLVTGAGGGLGSSAVGAAAAAGAELVLVDVTTEKVATLAAEHPDAVVGHHAVDLLDPAAVQRLADELAGGPGVDAVWHLVGGWRGGQPITEEPLEDWAVLYDLLVRTTVHVARSFAEPLSASQHGRFAIVSSPQALAPSANNAAYGATKAAAEATVLALADHFKGTPATANVVVVPAIVTPAMRAAKPDKSWGTFVPAEEIADALVYLSSEAAAKMNGQRLRLYVGSPT